MFFIKEVFSSFENFLTLHLISILNSNVKLIELISINYYDDKGKCSVKLSTHLVSFM